MNVEDDFQFSGDLGGVEHAVIYTHARRAAEVHAASAINARRIHVDDREDLIQEAMLGLCRQIGRFDPARSSIRTFVERVVYSKINSAIRTRRTIKRRFSEPLTEYEDPRRFAPDFEYRVDVQRALDRLSSYDRMVATMLVDTTPAEAARALRIARSTMYVVIARIRDVFVETGVYPVGYLAPAARKINVASHRTLSTDVAYVVSSQTNSGHSKSTRRTVYRKADTPVGGL